MIDVDYSELKLVLDCSVDVFVVDVRDVGMVNRINVRHDNSGFFGPGWYLKRVT